MPDGGLSEAARSDALPGGREVPGRLAVALRSLGHDVAWIRVEAPGADDRGVLAMAFAERRVLVTFDKDFGELAARAGLPATSGVILLRVLMGRPSELASRIAAVIAGRSEPLAQETRAAIV